VAGEECVFAIEHKRTNASFDDVGVELDAAVVEEPGEAGFRVASPPQIFAKSRC
jgi:hypothetical protein